MTCCRKNVHEVEFDLYFAYVDKTVMEFRILLRKSVQINSIVYVMYLILIIIEYLVFY